MSVTTPSLAQRLEFAPPQAPGGLPAAALALLAHLLLVAALTWGVQWKNQVDTPAIEAELWSAVALQAAPAAVAPPAPEPPVPAPPPPEPVVQPAPAPPAPDVREAQIALERDRQRAKAQEQEQQQALRLAEQKRKEEWKQRELEKKAKAQAEALAREKQAKEKLAKDKREKEELARKREAEQQQAAKADKAEKARQAAAKAEAEARHKEQVNRMLGMAGASGDANATGTALRSSGPSASYAGRIAARVKPNITFNDDVPGNPVAEVEVRVAPDGSVVGTPRLVKSSGYKNWDDAVIKAILKTETLPKDVDGRVQPVMVMGFRPKD